MVARRFRTSELVLAAALAAATALVAYAAIKKLGSAGLLAPLGLALVVVLLRRPLVLTCLVVGVAVLAEGPDFGLFTFTAQLYTHATVMNVMVALVVFSVGIDMLRHKRRPRVPAPLGVPLALLALASVAGLVTGHSVGISVSKELHNENLLDYMIFLPLAVANLDPTGREIDLLLKLVFALAIFKAVVGLADILSGYAPAIERSGALTYYEPTANWLMLLALLGVFGALIGRLRPPLWALLGSPLILAALLLSYRRSFWIAAVLGLLLVLVLALGPVGRRMLIPVALMLIAAVWLIGSVHVQGSSPLLERATSLAPSKITSNVEDRYRLDERANVLAEIEKHPVTGIGVGVPWRADARPLPIEHEGGRRYVHFAALWYWLNLGVLGFLAYVSLLLGGALLAWRVWRRGYEPIVKAFGLASLCAIAGLVAIETTASFSGVDTRFTVLFGAQLGLLALLSRIAVEQPEFAEEI
ncbi:MAG TPA: O-antigen ligase family protein [Solirubrobacteraceae bacterium]